MIIDGIQYRTIPAHPQYGVSRCGVVIRIQPGPRTYVGKRLSLQIRAGQPSANLSTPGVGAGKGFRCRWVKTLIKEAWGRCDPTFFRPEVGMTREVIVPPSETPTVLIIRTTPEGVEVVRQVTTITEEVL